ncbi:MAG TPA: oxidoreductase [Candidatus Paceibacterota bacterium]|nr:oxidoreductase [Verrucomicrobiota bacterium]HRY49688.1 oxidoreductase [Candidatus Paceibacterota bacterium]HSA01946.1 oxidoreductase [Candidatus Paceibacterota bacterium]
MPTRPKIGIYWCASCGGCEETVVDLAEDILGVVEKVDIVFWPVAMDFKKKDVEALPDLSLLATLLNGAVRSSEQEEMVRMLRRKSKYMIAFGSCAHTGGIPGLANQFSREHILRYVYEETPTTINNEKTRPQLRFAEADREVDLPEFRHVVRSLDQVVDVDYYIPGCPPTPNITRSALTALLDGRLPPKGTVLAPDIALCDECPRKATKPADLAFAEFNRPHQKLLDPSLCFLAQGIICMGPSTRSGCDAQCTKGNMPCTGCFGGTTRVKDQGAKMLSSLCANLVPKEEEAIDQVLDGLPDPIGTLYRYGLAKSLLRRRMDLPMETLPPAG